MSDSLRSLIAATMNLKRVTVSIATLSWIDPASKLPEFDAAGMPSPTLTEADVKTAPICRFANLLTVQAWIDSKQQVIHGYTIRSGSALHWRLSAFATRPQIYQTIRYQPSPLWTALVTTGDRVTVGQIVGCRTLAPEKVARGVGTVGGALANPFIPGGILVPIAGYFIGEESVEALNMVYPPIWTDIKVTIHGDGQVEGKVVGHSLFPSMTSYLSEHPAGGYTRQAGGYDGVPNLELWRATGWGARQSSAGPSGGSPWNAVDPR